MPCRTPLTPCLVTLALCAACAFDDATPAGAQFFCIENADCPAPLTCNLTTHLCGVDAVPPVIESASLVDPPDGAVYADVAPDNTIRARVVTVGEDPAIGARISAGPFDGGADACTSEDEGTFVCSVVLGAELVVHGPIDVLLTVRDAAGNQSTVALPAAIDSRPPQIVTGSVGVRVVTAGVETEIAQAESLVAIDFVTDEDLGEPPTVSMDVAGARVPLRLTDTSGRRFTFSRDTGPIADGTYALFVDLVDRFGHDVTDMPLPLPEPFEAGVRFQSDEEVCPPAPGETCVDLDGDDSAALGSCAGGLDEDDQDPTSFPGAPEVPGDGRDNDFIGGDAPIDETTGIFVDSELGSDEGAGTRDDPLLTFGAAAMRACPAGCAPDAPILFLAARDSPYITLDTEVTLRASVVGGLDPTTWARGAGTSVIAPGFRPQRLIDSVDCEGLLYGYDGPTTLFVRSRLATVQVLFSGTNVVDSYVGAFISSDSGSPAGRHRFVKSRFGQINGAGYGGHIVLVGSTVDGGVSAGVWQQSLVIANSWVAGGVGMLARHIAVFHSRLESSEPGAVAANLNASGDSVESVILVGNEIESAGGTPLTVSADTVVLATNRFTATSGDAPAFVNGASLADDAALNACAFSGCVAAHGNTTSGDGVDVGVNAAEWGGPAALVVGYDGACRYDDDAADIGPIEQP